MTEVFNGEKIMRNALLCCLAVAVLAVCGCSINGASQNGNAKPETPKGYDPSKKKDREAYWQELGRKNIVRKIETDGDKATLIVGRSFYSLPFDVKEKIVNALCEYANDLSLGVRTLFLKNETTGKIIGTYQRGGGLELD